MAHKKKPEVTNSSTVIWCYREEVAVCGDRESLQEALKSCQESWRGVVPARRGMELEERKKENVGKKIER